MIEWNGSDVPETLQRLPAGRYAIEPLDELPALTPDEERGLAQALESLRAGRVLAHDEVRDRVLKRAGQ